jgi:hypothetical protein
MATPSQSHLHFSKFDQAYAGCRSALEHQGNGTAADKQQRLAVAHFSVAAMAALQLGQRFYLPEAGYVLEGKLLDERIKSVMRLPFEVVSLLTETTVQTEQGEQVPTWEITIGFEIDSGFNRTYKLIDPRTKPGNGFAMFAVVKLAGGLAERHAPSAWIPIPVVGFCLLHDDRPGVNIILARTPFSEMLVAGGSGPQDLQDNAMAVANLCAMLSLKNTSTADRAPPPKVNKKRREAGKQELPSYKVLVVDGEAWDHPHADGSAGTSGVRSHLRRGHIRHLSDARSIWVRATYVHGSKPGFVDKDYAVVNGKSKKPGPPAGSGPGP